VVRISELLKGPKKVHYLVCFGKIDTLKLDPNAYSWKGREPLFSFTIVLRRKMLRKSKPKINLVEKRWVGVLPFIFKLKWMNILCKTRNRKEAGFMWALWNKEIVVNTWRVKVDKSINQT
jgi:hypothetical protein